MSVASKKAKAPAPHPVLDRGPKLRARADALQLTSPEPEWLGWNVQHRFVCKKGHEFRALPTSLKGTQSCPTCRYEVSLQRLHAAAQAMQARCLDSTWRGHTATYRFECAKGHQWEHNIRSLSCPACTGNMRPLQDGMTRLQQRAQDEGGVCLSGEYLGQKARYQFRCHQGHEWQTTGSEVLRGAWCRLCAVGRQGIMSRRADGLERLSEAAASKGGICLSDAYVGAAQRYRFRCAQGHEWATVGKRVLRGAWCPVCAHVQQGEGRRLPEGLERLQQLATQHGGSCLSPTYLGRSKVHRFCCAKGHEWEVTAASVIQGGWCMPCSRVGRRLGLEVAQAAAHARGGQCLSQTYANTATKMSWMCDRGHVWETVFGVIRAGKWCPTCAHMAQITNSNSKAWAHYRNAGRSKAA